MAEGKKLLPGIGPEDRRAPVDSAAWPWQAIGRLNVPTRGSCTATLIAADLVLTAAHCVFDRVTGARVAPSAVHFLPGFQRGEFAAHAIAAAIDTSMATFPPQRKVTSETIAADWALIRLRSPLSIRPIPVQRLDPAGVENVVGAATLMRAGYSQDRSQLLQVHRGCRILDRHPLQPVLFTDCDATRGDSGSPLLICEADRCRVIGVTSAVADNEQRRGTLVVSSEAFATRLPGQPAAATPAAGPRR